MKLIIDIPEKTIAHIRADYGHGYRVINDGDKDYLCDAIFYGTPFDSVIDDIKTEIDEQEFTHHNGLTHWYMTPSEVKSIVFEIIDKHISGKGTE